MISANKLYKESASDLPFKEWLRREQLKGNLDIHQDNYLNMVGEDDALPENDQDVQEDLMPPMMSVKEANRNRNFALVIGVVGGMLISKYLFKK
jgi:hypothetical protein|tara:strand:- start:520 stop:801 length:282 start_codon:yes stop_codon:yes gene_type:complete